MSKEPAAIGDEHALLRAFDQALSREASMLADGDADALLALADERERLSVRLFEAVNARRARGGSDAAKDAALIAIYHGLRQRHDLRASVVRLYADKNARAVSVLAQASGRTGVYGADGRAVRWATQT